MDYFHCRVCNELPTAYGYHVIVKHMGKVEKWHLQVCVHCWQILECMLDSGRFTRKERASAVPVKMFPELAG